MKYTQEITINTFLVKEPLSLSLEITMKKKWDITNGKYYLMNSPKLKFTFQSTNRDIDQSQEEFVELISSYLNHHMVFGTVQAKLKALGFKLNKDGRYE